MHATEMYMYVEANTSETHCEIVQVTHLEHMKERSTMINNTLGKSSSEKQREVINQ